MDDSHEVLFWPTSMDDLLTGPLRLGLCSYPVRWLTLCCIFVHKYLVAPQTFLTSRKNGLVTIYDVSRSDDGLIHSNVPAYSIPPVSSYYTPNTGHLLFRHTSNQSKTATTMYQLSERGSIHCLDLDFPPIGQLRRERECCEWSEDVQSLEETANVSSDMGLMASQVASKVDLHLAYQSKDD